MILDLNKFINDGQPVWAQLEQMLDLFDDDPDLKLDIKQLQQFHYLYHRTSADLAKLSDLSVRQSVRGYLESIVAKAYSRIHKPRRTRTRMNLFTWFFHTLPATFRKHIIAFWLALFILAGGSFFGAAAIGLDSDAKPSLMPFAHLMQDPAQRVAKEEAVKEDKIAGKKSSFASFLISNNTKVAFLTMSLGITWGTGTVLILFSNGAHLGATVADYILAGQSEFLMAWLLPHGSIEIPAILLAAQAGFMLAGALIGPFRKKVNHRPLSLKTRFRRISHDLFTLMGGVCLMLLWAGFIESFLSQYHEPVISYHTKILFGAVQLAVLFVFLFLSGKNKTSSSVKGVHTP